MSVGKNKGIDEFAIDTKLFASPLRVTITKWQFQNFIAPTQTLCRQHQHTKSTFSPTAAVAATPGLAAGLI